MSNKIWGNISKFLSSSEHKIVKPSPKYIANNKFFLRNLVVLICYFIPNVKWQQLLFPV